MSPDKPFDSSDEIDTYQLEDKESSSEEQVSKPQTEKAKKDRVVVEKCRGRGRGRGRARESSRGKGKQPR